MIVTEASSGIGKAVALQLADKGAYLALAARNAQRLESLAGECKQRRRDAIAIPTDEADESQCKALIQRAQKTYARIYTLVNYAGIDVVSKLEELLDLRPFKQSIDVNFYGTVHCIYYTGSFNLVDPRFFKQDAAVGEWVDAMVRLDGPGVLALNAPFRRDWEMETSSDLDEQSQMREPFAALRANGSDVQVIPSRPGRSGNSIYPILLMAIYSARREVVITTPYFIPYAAVNTALLTAAERAIKVTIIVPERNDSRLVHYTCRSYFDDMVSAGIHVFWSSGWCKVMISMLKPAENPGAGVAPDSVRMNGPIHTLSFSFKSADSS